MNKEWVKTKKKIIFLITKSEPFGGAQKYVFDLATSLSRDNFDISVVLGGEGKLKNDLQEKNIKTIALSSLQRNINIYKEFLAFKDLFFILWKEKPDILHVNSSKAGGLGSFLGRILSIKKIVFTAHGWAFNENRNWVQKFLISYFHWLTIMLAHKTIAVSEAIKKQVDYFPLVNKKIEVVHPGIKMTNFLSKEEARSVLNILGNKFVIGTIAELHPTKGLNVAIEAISLIKSKDSKLFEKLSYYIIGQGEQKEPLEKLIQEKKLDEKVFLLGYKPEASKYLKAFDLFLLPSLSEALGYVLLEAGLAGLSIIASNVGGIPEIIENNKTGLLFEAKNPEDLVRKIDEIKNDKGSELSINLNKKIIDQYNFQKMVDETIKVYESS